MSTPANFFATITATDGVADVIFVHGLSGDPVETWTFEGSSEAEGGYWPHWLASDLDGQIVAKLGGDQASDSIHEVSLPPVVRHPRRRADIVAKIFEGGFFAATCLVKYAENMIERA